MSKHNLSFPFAPFQTAASLSPRKPALTVLRQNPKKRLKRKPRTKILKGKRKLPAVGKALCQISQNPIGQREEVGVTDGTRTRDNQNHNLGLYQLSYGHHRTPKVAKRSPVRQASLFCFASHRGFPIAKGLPPPSNEKRKPPLALRSRPFFLILAGSHSSPLLFRFQGNHFVGLPSSFVTVQNQRPLPDFHIVPK